VVTYLDQTARGKQPGDIGPLQTIANLLHKL